MKFALASILSLGFLLPSSAFAFENPLNCFEQQYLISANSQMRQTISLVDLAKLIPSTKILKVESALETVLVVDFVPKTGAVTAKDKQDLVEVARQIEQAGYFFSCNAVLIPPTTAPIFPF